MKKFWSSAALTLLALLCVCCFAACGQTTYSVVFKVSETESITTTVIEKGLACEPNVDCCDGVYVAGWYTDEALTKAFDFKKAVESDLTLYPKYLSTVYNVLYDPNYPDCETPDRAVFTKDGNLVLAAAPERIGYEFKGWSDGESVFEAGSVYQTAGKLRDLVFSARWEYREVRVKLVNDEDSLIEEVTIPYNGSVVPDESLCATSHKFFWCFEVSGWDTSLRNITEDITIAAQYEYKPTAEKYFNFKLNGEETAYVLTGTNGNLPEAVALPESYQGKPVVSMASGAIQNSFSMKMLYVPGSYETIESNAVNGNYMLETIVLADGVSRLGIGSFSNYSLRKVFIPDSLEDWGFKTFYGYGGTEFVLTGDNQNLIQENGIIYDAEKTTVYIGGADVEGDIVFPATVTKVSNYAFAQNQKITGIAFPGKVDVVEAGAFYYCSLLSKIEFEAGVRDIRGHDEAERNRLIEKYGDTGSGDWTLDGAFLRAATSAPYDPETFEPIGLPGIDKLVLKGIEHIGTAAFQDAVLKNIEIDSTIKTIGEAAFTNNDYGWLTSIKMIGATENEFIKIVGNCIIEKGTGPVYNNKKGDRLLIYAQNAPASEFEVPAGVTYIAPFAFNGLTNLDSVVLPEGLTELAGATFYGGNYLAGEATGTYSSLQSVTLPSTLLKIRDDVKVYGVVTQMGRVLGAFDQCNLLSEVIFRGTPSLSEIGASAFRQTALTAFEIPATVTYIRQTAFLGLELVSLTVAEGNTHYIAEDGVLYSYDKTVLKHYPAAKTATTFTIADGIELVDEYSCELIKNLETLIVGKDVKKIGNAAFFRCEKLSEITFEGPVELLQEKAFFGNVLLRNVIFKGMTAPDLRGSHWYDYGVFDSGYDSMTMEAELKTGFSVPAEAYGEYFRAFNKYAADYANAIDKTGLSETAYTFVSNGGSVVEGANTLVFMTEPKTSWAGEGEKYFYGWFANDGTQNGVDWGDRVPFPAFFNAREVTLYARFEDTRLQDGKTWETRIVLPEDGKTFKLVYKENAYFEFVATSSGTVELLINDKTVDQILREDNLLGGLSCPFFGNFEDPSTYLSEVVEGQTYYFYINPSLYERSLDCKLSVKITPKD